jgi:hypothetical protein
MASIAEISISFDTSKLGKKDLDTLFEIEKKFREIGITFDTGGGMGQRDWEWDFSLNGPVKIYLIKEYPIDEKEMYNN